MRSTLSWITAGILCFSCCTSFSADDFSNSRRVNRKDPEQYKWWDLWTDHNSKQEKILKCVSDTNEPEKTSRNELVISKETETTEAAVEKTVETPKPAEENTPDSLKAETKSTTDTNTTPGIADLVSMLKTAENQTIRQEAIDKLIKFGPKAVEPVLPLVMSENKAEQISAIIVLREIRATKAYKPFVRLLSDKSPVLRFHAGHALVKMSGRDKGYRFAAAPEEREKAIAKWKDFLSENGISFETQTTPEKTKEDAPAATTSPKESPVASSPKTEKKESGS